MSYTICIPSVDKKYNKKFIYNIIDKYKFGKIKKIITVPNSFNSNIVFIGFHYWFYNEENNKLKELLNNKECFKIIHDFPWFWKCYKAERNL